ncbi:MAG: hypothetical protein M3096_09395 [Actinomycetia bacterium]|nr:hypothetical protein [Actinomycetes bacterium]
MSRTTILPLLLAFGLFGAACSSGTTTVDVASLDADSGDTQTASDDGSIVGEESVLAFTACLRDEGLNVDDPGVDEEGNLVPPTPHAIAGETLDMAAVHSAFAVCQGLLEDVTFGLSTEDLSEREDELLAFAVCMRDNGYDMPDPDFSGDGHTGAGPFGDAIDTDNPAFQTASQSCDGIIGS